jgi:hypothetical protein
MTALNTRLAKLEQAIGRRRVVLRSKEERDARTAEIVHVAARSSDCDELTATMIAMVPVDAVQSPCAHAAVAAAGRTFFEETR